MLRQIGPNESNGKLLLQGAMTKSCHQSLQVESHDHSVTDLEATAIYPNALQGEGIRSRQINPIGSDWDLGLENSSHTCLRNPKPNMSEKLPPISGHLSLQAPGPAPNLFFLTVPDES